MKLSNNVIKQPCAELPLLLFLKKVLNEVYSLWDPVFLSRPRWASSSPDRRWADCLRRCSSTPAWCAKAATSPTRSSWVGWLNLMKCKRIFSILSDRYQVNSHAVKVALCNCVVKAGTLIITYCPKLLSILVRVLSAVWMALIHPVCLCYQRNSL